MPTTTNRGYSVPVTGTEVDTWGDNALNPNFATIDQNLGAITSLSLSNTDVTLNAAQYACGTIILTGTLTGNLAVIFPSVQGWWSVDNQTTGNFVVTLKTASGNVIGMPPGEQIDIQVNGSSGVKFRNLGRVGSEMFLATTAVPAWITACTIPPYLNEDGSTFSAITYPALAAFLGGTTLPDARGRGRFNLNQTTGRITTAGSGIDGDTLFASGGAQEVTLDTTQIPAHLHSITDKSHSHLARYAEGIAGGSGTTRVTNVNTDTSGNTWSTQNSFTGITGTNNAGGGLAHNNVPPAYIGGITLIRAA